jgi:hypothetical protein
MRADDDVLARVAEQRRHQVRVGRARRPWWIPWLFVVGACLSIFGLVLSVQTLSQDGPTVRLFVFALATIFFGWVVAMWLTAPLWIRPRIVPYFARELGEYGGTTMVAFRGGRALYREIVALDRLARTLGVMPLSVFGFVYDHYDQKVRWHPASDGLRSVDALRRGLAAEPLAATGVVDDLEALAVVLRAANDQGVDFSLVLRLYAKDSMQAVCTREVRQGSFW